MNNKITNKPSLLSTFVFSGIAAGSYAAWKYLTRRSSSEDVIDEDIAILRRPFDEDFITPRCSFDEDDITSVCTFDKYVNDLIRQEISRAYEYSDYTEHKAFFGQFEYMDQLIILQNRNNRQQSATK
jgi:hypothetical protein